MGFTYGFYNSVGGDRTYDAIQVGQLMKGVISDGIFSLIGTAMRVTNGGGLTANVGVGKAWFNGTWSDNDAVLPVVLDTADALLPRIDAIILEVDQNPGVRANTIKFIKGTPGSSPANPTLITGGLKNQYALAYILIPAASAVLGTITDNVGTIDTPYITTGLEPSLPKATVGEIQAGTVQNKYIDPKNLKDSINYPNAAPSTAGNIMRSNGTNWVSGQDHGWISDPNTWTYSSVDGPTGIMSINADMTLRIRPGMRLKYNQALNHTLAQNFNSNSASGIGSFTINDTAMSYTAGKISNAATFNGTTSKIVITDVATLKPTGMFTLGFWMKTATANRGIWQSYSQNTFNAGISVMVNGSGKILLTIGRNTGTTSLRDYMDFVGLTTVTDNAWHYVVITFIDNIAQVYVDGKVDAFGYSVAPAYAATNYIQIGCRNLSGTDSAFFNGQIDDLFFMNGRIISEETIMAKYLAATTHGTSIVIDKTAIVTRVGDFLTGTTLITAYHGTDSHLENQPITNPLYSGRKTPGFGFNMSPNKWTCYGMSRELSTINTPINNIYSSSSFTPASVNVSGPIGIWNISAKMSLEMLTTAVAGLYGVRLGIQSSGGQNPDWTIISQVANDAAAIKTFMFPMQLYIPNVVVNVKANFSFMVFPTPTGNMTSIKINDTFNGAFIYMVCAYL